MLENSLKRYKELTPGTAERATKSDSKVKLSALSPSQLLDRARNLSNEVRKLSSQNKALRIMLKKQKQKLSIPNFHPTFDELSDMVNFAVANKVLKQGTILYSFMLDALSQLKLHQPSSNNESDESQKRPSNPKNMHWDPLTIKLAISLSVKCKQKGYEAVRKWLPLPSWRLVQEYRNMNTSADPVDMAQLERCWNEIRQRGICNLFGLHWDEIDIRSGVKLCRRTGQLIGFEDFTLPTELEMDIELNETSQPLDQSLFEEENENYYTSDDESDDTHYADSDSENDSTRVPKPKTARQICQFFLTSLEGDFTWPVASFPVYSVTAEKLNKHMIWPLIKALDKVSNSNIKVVYGVCDGGPWNSKFFRTSSKKTPWVGQNEVTGGDIFWISDYPHTIKKLRNFMNNPNYNLTYQGRTVHWDHVAAVAKQENSLLKSKHVFIDSKSKMKVMLAREVLSEPTAKAMEDPCFPYTKHETSFTRKYIRMCDRLFRIMNSVSLHPNYMQELLSVLLFFKRWHDETEEKVKSYSSKDEKKAVRKQFIPVKTYNDFLVLIRGTIALIGFVKINFPHINIVPKSLYQDDVENYFSLVRGREVSPTVQRYMEIRQTLDIDFGITQELGLLDGSSSSYEGPAVSPQPLHLMKNQNRKGKTVERANTVCTIKQMISQNQANCEEILVGEKCPALPSYSEDQKKKLECQCLEILTIIEQSLPTTVINSTHLVLDSLSDSVNRSYVMNFNMLLDQKLKSEYFNLKSFHKDTYNTAWTQLLLDKHLYCWWSSLCNLICGGSNATEEAMELYLRKFVKRRCVYHLMKEDLSPLSGHTAAIRTKLTRTAIKNESPKEAAPTDVCRRCNMLGHWAKNCTNPPEPEWLAKQECYKCGIKGHLAAQCSNTRTRIPPINVLLTPKA